MTRDGFLTADRPQLEGGKAAQGSLLDPPTRDRLYTHRFPGAHSRSQVEGALAIAFGSLPAVVRTGQPLAFSIVVDNRRSGHKMPTGSADLRLLWIEVTARSGDRIIAVPPRVRATGGYGYAGSGELDASLLRGDVPDGCRIYRAVFFDASGKQTLSSYDAIRVVWDNRLEAGEKRVEPYELVLPTVAARSVRIEARLVYLSYPSALARRFEVAPAAPVEVATATAELRVAPGTAAEAPSL